MPSKQLGVLGSTEAPTPELVVGNCMETWAQGANEERQAAKVASLKRRLEVSIDCEANVQGSFDNKEMRNRHNVGLYCECNARSSEDYWRSIHYISWLEMPRATKKKWLSEKGPFGSCVATPVLSNVSDSTTAFHRFCIIQKPFNGNGTTMVRFAMRTRC